MNWELSNLLVFAGYAFIGLGATAICGVAWHARHRFGRDYWRQVRATVVSSNVEPRGDGSVVLSVAYRYHAGGRFRDGEYRQIASPDDPLRRAAILERADRIARQGLARVLVNPADPGETLPAPLRLRGRRSRRGARAR